MSHTEDNVAAAVHGYIVALRHLRRETTTVLEIAQSLGLEPKEVEQAINGYRMGAEVLSEERCSCGPMSRVVRLRRRAAKRKPKERTDD